MFNVVDTFLDVVV